MISEKTIDRVISQFEDGSVDYETAVQDFGESQPAILSFLLSDHEGALTADERDFILYLAVVIWKSVSAEQPVDDKVSAATITDAEEANWEIMDANKGKVFRDRLDVFFESTDQEDLLALIEDSLTLEEVDDGGDGIHITPEGIEPMFVTLKTVVDVLTS